jgi:hypothetical protein
LGAGICFVAAYTMRSRAELRIPPLPCRPAMHREAESTTSRLRRFRANWIDSFDAAQESEARRG